MYHLMSLDEWINRHMKYKFTVGQGKSRRKFNGNSHKQGNNTMN